MFETLAAAGARSGRPSLRNRARRALQLAIGLLLLGLVWRYQDSGREALKQFEDFRWRYVGAMAATTLFLLWISCLKWRLFLRREQLDVSVVRLMRLYVVGRFFNLFFPSTIGADTARSYLLGRQVGDQQGALVSVFLERATGLVALVGLAAIFGLGTSVVFAEPVVAWVIAGLALVCVLAVAAIASSRPLDALRWLLAPVPGSGRLLDGAGELRETVISLRCEKRLVAKALAYSVVFHLGTSVKLYAACLAVNAHPRFWVVFAVMPVILLLQTLPVSAGNLGWWEWSCSVLLLASGLSLTQGLAVALTERGFSIAQSLLGGVLLLFERSPAGRGPVEGSD